MDWLAIKHVVATVAIAAGTILSVLGIVGMIRLPDIFTRLHATGKVSVFGVALLLVAAGLVTPYGLGRAVVLIVVLVIAGPVLAHALAAAAQRRRVPMARAQDSKRPVNSSAG